MNQPPAYRRTRIAPTPSGFLHLGNVLSFVYTLTLARQYGAKVLLRIDDLDQARAAPAYLQDIFDTLHFLELPWNEGPRNAAEFASQYSQVHRMQWYTAALDHLRAEGQVFACNCSRAQVQQHNAGGVYPGTCRHKGLPLDTPGTSWRCRTDERELRIRQWNGEVLRTGLPAVLKDSIVKKRDGFPAYQLTSVVDDLHYQVDLVVRGEDLWPSTIVQHYLAEVLGQGQAFGSIAFAHHPLLLNAQGHKLSKSAGDTSIQYLRRQGCRKSEVFRQIAWLLGVPGEPANWAEVIPAPLWVAKAQ